MILGYTSTTTAMLDMDRCTLSYVKKTTRTLDSRFHLEGYIILKSSTFDYHVIFNRPLTWGMALRVIFASPPCRKRYHNHFSWAEMQAIKGAATLRLGPKGRKHPPRPVFTSGLQDKEISRYLSLRRQFNP
jgi:hypothetical protein